VKIFLDEKKSPVVAALSLAEKKAIAIVCLQPLQDHENVRAKAELATGACPEDAMVWLKSLAWTTYCKLRVLA